MKRRFVQSSSAGVSSQHVTNAYHEFDRERCQEQAQGERVQAIQREHAFQVEKLARAQELAARTQQRAQKRQHKRNKKRRSDDDETESSPLPSGLNEDVIQGSKDSKERDHDAAVNEASGKHPTSTVEMYDNA